MKKLFAHIGQGEIRSGLAIIIVIGIFALLFTLVFVPIPEHNNELLYLAMGQILGIGGIVVSYFFGSSKNESDAGKEVIKKINNP